MLNDIILFSTYLITTFATAPSAAPPDNGETILIMLIFFSCNVNLFST